MPPGGNARPAALAIVGGVQLQKLAPSVLTAGAALPRGSWQLRPKVVALFVRRTACGAISRLPLSRNPRDTVDSGG
eukprot:12920730-Prorocentrum_lima.AAC.1